MYPTFLREHGDGENSKMVGKTDHVGSCQWVSSFGFDTDPWDIQNQTTCICSNSTLASFWLYLGHQQYSSHQGPPLMMSWAACLREGLDWELLAPSKQWPREPWGWRRLDPSDTQREKDRIVILASRPVHTTTITFRKLKHLKPYCALIITVIVHWCGH